MIREEQFGQTKDKKPVSAYRLVNQQGNEAVILNYGAILKNLIVDGIDMVAGYENLGDYEADPYYLGAIIGRTANRIGEGHFTLDGVDYSLFVNNGPNCNHGGLEGFNKKVFDAKIQDDRLILSYTSPDGEEGYPGKVSLRLEYTFDDANQLKLVITAKTDQATLLSLTAHHYFNLEGCESLEHHRLKVFSDQYTVSDENLLPTGEIRALMGTPLDLREGIFLTEDYLTQDHPELKKARGIDHNYIVKRAHSDALVRMAELSSLQHTLTLFSDQPGFQVYTGNWLEAEGKKAYRPYSAVALEAQSYPDSIHHPDFPQDVLRPGEIYQKTIVYTIQKNPEEEA